MAGRRRRTLQSSNSIADFEIDGHAGIACSNQLVHDTVPKFNFSDIENLIRKFSGSDAVSVKNWILEFEQYAHVFRWNDLQKFVFCKRALVGAARLFIDYEAKPLTYPDLKSALFNEFHKKLSSAEVHNKLRERKKRNNESCREYLYAMLDIGSQSEVDDSSIIAYVIDGINDTVSNKIVLYGAKTIGELKEKLLIYEKIKSVESVKSKKESEMKTKLHKRTEELKNKKHCFNCGSCDHEFHACPEKAKGPKCFKCNQFGHKRPDCPENATDRRSSAHVITTTKSSVYVPIRINSVLLESLIDTGSDICLLKECCLKLISPVNIFRNSSSTISGLGADVRTRGSCLVTIEINGETYSDIEVHIVEDKYLKPNMIIGMSLLNQAVVSMDGGDIQIKKKYVTSVENEQLPEKEHTCFLANIAVEEFKKDVNLPDLNHLKKEDAVKVTTLIRNYLPGTPDESPIRMKIVTVDDEPVYHSPRRFSPVERRIIDKQVAEWVQNGIVSESTSDYASQVVLVKKKDGSYRLCVDYRKINKKIHKDRYPIPNIEDQIDRLQKAKYFTTLDLENGFFHVAVEESSKKYTSFVTQSGQYQFNKVPFGLCNSPSTFQKYINLVLKDLINNNFVLVYLDDIVIPSVSIEEGIQKLTTVLEVAAKNGLRIKWTKCQILQDEVEYLGHCIRNGCILPSPSKTKAVINFPVPRTQKQLQSFLGLANYFRKFIPNFAVRARPLSDLLKKDKYFKMKEEQLAAIDDLKKALVTRPVLKIFKYGATTELHTDASIEGYGAVLFQRDDDDNQLHPTYYMSKKTSDAEKKYTSYELEVLAIIEALKKFRVYLLGQKFKLVTDCKAFECTMKKKELTTRVARWALLLEEFDYEIEHRARSKMGHVDALSRSPIVMCVSKENEFLKKLAESQRKDERLQAIMEILRERPYKDYTINGGILYKNVNNKSLFVVPDSMKHYIIRETHEKGHFHQKKMKDMIEKEFYIPDLDKRITKHIGSCVRCILAERKKGKAEGLLCPIPKGEKPLETFHIDHLGPLESTQKNYKYIFAVIDGFTKYCWLFPSKTLKTDEAIKKIEIIAETFGYPERIIADKGGAFTSNQFRDFCKERQVKLHFITVGIPRGNGQVERLHSTVIAALTKLSVEDPAKWYKHVKPLQQILNSTYQRAIKTTPFHLLVGIEMKTKKDLKILNIIEEEIVKKFEDARREQREQAKKDIAKIQEENRKHYNKRRKEAVKYNVGDLVAIERTQFGTGLKVRPKFLGPYRVIGIKEFDRYIVEKEGEHEGQKITDSCAEKMKPWSVFDDEDDANADENDEIDDEDDLIPDFDTDTEENINDGSIKNQDTFRGLK